MGTWVIFNPFVVVAGPADLILGHCGFYYLEFRDYLICTKKLSEK